MPIQLQDRMPFSEKQLGALSKALKQPGMSSLWVDPRTGMLSVRLHGEALDQLDKQNEEASVD